MKKVFTLKTINYIMIAMALVFTVGCDWIGMSKFQEGTTYYIPMMDGDRWTYKKFDSTGSVSLGNRYFLKANNKYYSFCLAENGEPLPGVNMILDNACVFALYPDLKYLDSSDCAVIEINNIRPQAGMLIWYTPIIIN